VPDTSFYADADCDNAAAAGGGYSTENDPYERNNMYTDYLANQQYYDNHDANCAENEIDQDFFKEPDANITT
jgi:hypothetical protein